MYQESSGAKLVLISVQEIATHTSTADDLSMYTNTNRSMYQYDNNKKAFSCERERR